MDNQQNLLYSAWRSAQYYVPDWMGGESGGEWIHVYVWLSPFAVHLKLPPKKKKKNQLYLITKCFWCYKNSKAILPPGLCPVRVFPPVHHKQISSSSFHLP